MQAPPGAPGTARQGNTRIIMLVNNGGIATQPRAPGHDRPRAALRAARHGRLSAASTAPGADVLPTTTAGAPGRYCLSAAPRAPGHGRPLAITARVSGRDRLSAALRAPADDAAPAITAIVPSHHRPSAAPIATVSSPAGSYRLHPEGLPHTPANPRTLTYSHTCCLSCHSRLPPRHSRLRGNHRPPVATGGPQGGQTHPTTHQAHPAIQVPPHPRSCSTACTGNHPARAPPTPAHRKLISCRHPPSPPCGEGPGVRLVPSPRCAGGP